MTRLDVRQARSEALDEIEDGLWLVDAEGRVIDANRCGRSLLDALGGLARARSEPWLADLLEGEVPAHAEGVLRAEDGEELVLSARSFRRDAWPAGVRACVLRDVTHGHAAQPEQSLLANYDSLTGLPNRRLFEKQLDAALVRAAANGTVVALLLLDLDQFKQTNDSMGHAAGDELLSRVAEAIRGVVRGRDVVSRLAARTDEHSVARLGGDEFAIILGDVARSEDSTDIAARVLAALRRPVEIQGMPVYPSASIGVAVHPADAADRYQLTVAADQALYRAKELGRNQVQLYHPTLNDRASHRREIARELAKAIEDDALEVVYQPIVGLREGEVRGAEALVRWTHPTLGETSPGEFVDIAEKTGLVDRLGRWVLDRVLGDVAKHADPDYDRRVSINVSSIELRNPRYAEHVIARLAAHDVSARHLELEITERAFLAESDAVTRNLRSLRRLGVRVALDDFGAGRSSISDLVKHRLDGVKVDRTFVARHQSDRVASGVLRAILQMARELRIHAVAQGVETKDEAVSLRRLGCEEGQGFFFGRPVGPLAYFAAVGREVEVPDVEPSPLDGSALDGPDA